MINFRESKYLIYFLYLTFFTSFPLRAEYLLVIESIGPNSSQITVKTSSNLSSGPSANPFTSLRSVNSRTIPFRVLDAVPFGPIGADSPAPSILVVNESHRLFLLQPDRVDPIRITNIEGNVISITEGQSGEVFILTDTSPGVSSSRHHFQISRISPDHLIPQFLLGHLNFEGSPVLIRTSRTELEPRGWTDHLTIGLQGGGFIDYELGSNGRLTQMDPQDGPFHLLDWIRQDNLTQIPEPSPNLEYTIYHDYIIENIADFRKAGNQWIIVADIYSNGQMKKWEKASRETRGPRPIFRHAFLFTKNDIYSTQWSREVSNLQFDPKLPLRILRVDHKKVQTSDTEGEGSRTLHLPVAFYIGIGSRIQRVLTNQLYTAETIYNTTTKGTSSAVKFRTGFKTCLGVLMESDSSRK